MAHVIRIHSGYKLILAVFHALIQRIAKSPVFRKSMNIETAAKFLLHFRNDRIQFPESGIRHRPAQNYLWEQSGHKCFACFVASSRDVLYSKRT